MSAVRMFLCFAFLVATINACLIPDKKENQEIHVFHIGSPESKSGSEPDIIELHIPDGRRRRGTSKGDTDAPRDSCKQDSDCAPDSKCSSKTSACQSRSSQLAETMKKGNLGGGVFEYFITNK